MKAFNLLYSKLIEGYTGTRAPYGFIIWSNGEYEAAGGDRGEHHEVINRRLNLPMGDIFYEFFKSGGIRMTSEWNYGNGWSEEAFKKYWIETDITRASRKNIKLAKDLALMYGKSYEVTNMPCNHFKR